VLTALLFSAALVLLVVAIVSHNAIPLFVMWVPLLAVPLVLGRAEPGIRPVEPEEVSSEVSATDEGDEGTRSEPGDRD
jgi:hypothetical protein